MGIVKQAKLTISRLGCTGLSLPYLGLGRPAMAQPRLNLRNVSTLLVDSDHFTRGLVAQMLRGFGMESPSVYTTGEQAINHLSNHYADLIIMEAQLPDMSCVDVIRWLRRQEKSPFRFAPIIVMSGYTQIRMVSAARDCGANIVVKKPLSPTSLFDRITWVARNNRPFIEAGDYIGPDRRFRDEPPPDGQFKRDTDEQEQRPVPNAVAGQQAVNSAA
ncbi:MAG: response regulator [Alphaproteobacteria bacterium]|nr:response regulator [Alphaproteobacteria bacterium]